MPLRRLSLNISEQVLRKRNRALFCLLVVGCCLSAVALAQDAASKDVTPYTLAKRVYKSGEIGHFKITMNIHSGEMNSKVDLRWKETTKDTKPSGEFTLLAEFETAVAKSGEMEQDIISALPVVTVMRDKAGKVTNKTQGGIDPVSGQFATLIQSLVTVTDTFAPPGPVKIGDKWKVTGTGFGASGVKSTGEATLAGTEVIDGLKTVKLTVATNVDNKADDIKAHSDTIVNIDPATGKLVRMSAKLQGTTKGTKLMQDFELGRVTSDK